MPAKVSVMEEEWDYLFILDACRYDYFSSIYQDFLVGSLEKRVSTGSYTLEWCRNSFHRHYPDVIYVSGNPYVNSRKPLGGFYATKHFHRVIDVWDHGWENRLRTVPPANVNKTARRLITKKPDKKFILHYLQPHTPYISNEFRTNRYSSLLSILLERIGEPRRILKELLASIGHFLQEKAEVTLSSSIMTELEKKHGLAWIRKAYRDNLRIVLRHVTRLCKAILTLYPERRIVISSDHGELLGENGEYDHWGGSDNPLLLEVPWLRVEEVSQDTVVL